MRTVWTLARVALFTVGVLAGAGRGCGSPVRATQRHRLMRTAEEDRPSAGEKPKLTVRVYNYARVNPASLISAEGIAGTLFAVTGVETAWVDCPLSKAEYGAHPLCQTSATPTDIDLKILPQRMAEKLQMHDEPIGFALPCSDDVAACEVTIFYYMVDHLATYGYRADAILGHAIAHEIAHVLIGGGHSAAGIMRAEWSRSELQKMSWGVLVRFDEVQSEALVAAAHRREMARKGFQEEARGARVDLGWGAK